MFPTSLAPTAQSLETTSPATIAPFQNNVVAPMNPMPPASYSTTGGTTGHIQGAMLTPANAQQQSTPQPVIFPGNPGSFFLTQSPSIGGAPVMLAPGQTPPAGAFVVAQPVPPPGNTGSVVPPTNCIIRLPDGRLVFPAQAPSSAGLTTANPPTYFSVAMSGTGPQSQQQVGMFTPNSNQTFYIQVPSTPGQFGGTVIATSCAAGSTPFQPQLVNTMVKVTQPNSGANPISFSHRHPVLVPSPMPALQTKASVAGTIPNTVGSPATQNFCGIMPSDPSKNAQCLPNGAYIVSSCPSQPPTDSRSQNSCKSVSSAGRRQTSTRAKGEASTVTLLHRLDEQIRILRGMATLSEAQATRLKQLVDVREQLSKASHTNSSSSTTQALNTGSKTVDISLQVRRELLDLLSQNNLLPRVTPPLTSETVIIEFRLNTQSYSLRLTKQQKADIERILYSVNSQRQAEILTVLQQEQARVYGTRPRMLIPATTSSTTQSYSVAATTVPTCTSSQPQQQPSRLHTFPSLSMHPTTFSGPSGGIRFVTARQVVPGSAVANTLVRGTAVTLASNTPMMGLVTALAIPPIAGQTPVFAQNLGSSIPNTSAVGPQTANNNAQMGGAYLSSALTSGTPTFVMQQPVIVSQPASVDGAVRVQSTPTPLVPATQSGQPLSAAALKQATRLSRLRSYLMQDMKRSVERPSSDASSGKESLLSPLELLDLLAPYHIHQDNDNTEDALNKVDHILKTATSVLECRKKQVIEAVNAQYYRDLSHPLEHENEDRLLASRMALDLEQDILTIEREEFNGATKELDDSARLALGLKTMVTESSSVKSDDLTVNNPLLTVYQQRLDHGRKRHCPTYLKHSASVYPPPWSSSLGSLAFLRPLRFSTSGTVEYASIDFPSVIKAESDSHLPSSGTPVSNSNADDMEADLLLGLGVQSTQTRIAGGSNGMARDLDLDPTQSAEEGGAFDETYDLWQELMREEGMDIEGMESDSCLDGASVSLLSDQTSKKSGQLENGSTDSVQHSEDPDLDAAIRSILTSSH